MKQSKFKETEIGKIPEGWNVKGLGNLIDLKTGKLDSNAAEQKGEYPFFTCAPSPLRINKHAFDCEAILLAGNNANGIFHINRYAGKFNAYQRTYVITTGNETNLDYLFYALQLYLNYFKDISQGTATKFLTKRIIENLKIGFPNLQEQKAIAKILSGLDSKIELNNEINKTLEFIGQMLFKHWFIDFEFSNNEGKPYKSSGGEMVDAELGEIPKGWSVKELGDYVDVVKGCSYRSDDLQESDKALVTLKSIERGGGFKVDGLKQYIGKYKDEQIISPGEIVVSHTDITQKAEVLGKSAIVRKVPKFSTLIASLDLCIVRPVINMLNRPFVYFLLRTDNFQNHAFGYANGTTVLHLNKKAIPEYVFVLPPKDLIHKFGVIVNNIMEKIQENELNSETFTFMRDSLLPRLMSGRIRVKVAE